MKKKEYKQPTMKIAQMKHRNHLLVVSGSTTFSANRGDDYGEEVEW